MSKCVQIWYYINTIISNKKLFLNIMRFWFRSEREQIQYSPKGLNNDFLILNNNRAHKYLIACVIYYLSYSRGFGQQLIWYAIYDLMLEFKGRIKPFTSYWLKCRTYQRLFSLKVSRYNITTLPPTAPPPLQPSLANIRMLPFFKLITVRFPSIHSF